jgi:hypothetical protein
LLIKYFKSHPFNSSFFPTSGFEIQMVFYNAVYWGGSKMDSCCDIETWIWPSHSRKSVTSILNETSFLPFNFSHVSIKKSVQVQEESISFFIYHMYFSFDWQLLLLYNLMIPEFTLYFIEMSLKIESNFTFHSDFIAFHEKLFTLNLDRDSSFFRRGILNWNS